MSDRIEISKIHPTVMIGPPEDTLGISKLTVYFLLEPGSSTPGETTNQGHVYVQIVEN